MMDDVLRLVAEALKVEPLREECKIKINRAELSPIKTFLMGKEQGARNLALELKEALELAGYTID